jgi:hypothetical protein
MKVIVDGKEIDLITELKPGEKELDLLTPRDNNKIDLEDTIEITEEMLKKIEEEEDSYE